MVKPNSPSLMAEKGETSNENKEVKYKGVRKRKWGKWVSEIRLPNSRERIWLGSHNTAEKAARAFDAALFCLRGRNAKFNFPETPPPDSILGGGGGGRSLTSTEIQVVAAHYANSGRQEAVSTSAGGQVMEGTSSTSTSNGMASVEAIDRSLFEMVEPSHDHTVLDYSLISGLNDLDDDMYMQSHLGPMIEDNEEENDQEDGDYSHKSNFLWNF